ncbi:MAG TPA: phosphatase PAP2 family protein [Armatimonadota bacterium]|jgi:undecaprenyl-diphosphatase
MHGLAIWDQTATLWINQHYHPALDAVLLVVSWLGNGGYLWLAAAALLALAGGRRDRWAAALFVAGLVLTEFALRPLLHDLWPRPRPFLTDPNIRLLLPPLASTSFPSSHAYLWAEATVLFGAFYRPTRGPLVALTLLTMYSRCYLGVHWLSDVLAGALLGTLVGLLEVAVARRLGWLHPPPPAEPPSAPPSP